MKIKRRSSYFTEIGWYLVRLILSILQMDPIALAAFCLVGFFTYKFVELVSIECGFFMAILLLIFVAGSGMAGIAKFVGLIYVSHNIDNISGNLNARFDNLVSGKENTFIPTCREGFKKFPCKYMFFPDNESDKADLRGCKTNWWSPKESEKRITKTKTLSEKYVIVARWKDRGYVPGWYMEFTIVNGNIINEPSEYAVLQAAKLKKRK